MNPVVLLPLLLLSLATPCFAQEKVDLPPMTIEEVQSKLADVPTLTPEIRKAYYKIWRAWKLWTVLREQLEEDTDHPEAREGLERLSPSKSIAFLTKKIDPYQLHAKVMEELVPYDIIYYVGLINSTEANRPIALVNFGTESELIAIRNFTLDHIRRLISEDRLPDAKRLLIMVRDLEPLTNQVQPPMSREAKLDLIDLIISPKHSVFVPKSFELKRYGLLADSIAKANFTADVASLFAALGDFDESNRIILDAVLGIESIQDLIHSTQMKELEMLAIAVAKKSGLYPLKDDPLYEAKKFNLDDAIFKWNKQMKHAAMKAHTAIDHQLRIIYRDPRQPQASQAESILKVMDYRYLDFLLRYTAWMNSTGILRTTEKK